MELWKDGFDHYGEFDGASGPGQSNMLAGSWAQLDNTVTVADNPSWGARTGSGCLGNHISANGARRVLPAATDPLIIAFGWSVTQLPNANGQIFPISLREGANKTVGGLCIESTGAISLRKSSITVANGVLDTVIATTAGPVVVPENWHFFEMKIGVAAGTFRLDIDGVTVITLTGVTWSNSASVAQIAVLLCTPSGSTVTQYCDDLIVRDTTGTRNNDFEGDLRIAALYPNSDAAAQGWTARPRHKFGTGILDNRAQTSSCVTAGTSTSTDLGSGDYTIEDFVRFYALPTGANKGVIFGKWDETNNRRSYQLYLGGPSLEAGNIVFRISTNGLAGTVAELISWPWTPDLDHWYHVAVSRAGGELFLFIDGVQQGLAVADSNVYFAGAARTVLGGQFDGAAIANTAFTGFMDEFRLTVGFARYNADFTPPVAPFPRSVAGDPNFANVQWLSGFDSGINDESSVGRLLTAQQGSVQSTPDDGAFNFQVIAHTVPQDDTFIEAPLIPASSILTQIAQPLTTKTVTVGTKDGSTPAVYTWKAALTTAFDVLIGASLNASLANLVAAINGGAGSGVVYGTGTTANNDVNAIQLPIEQILVQANVPGTAGDAIATATNDANGSWTGSTLAGGVDIPGPSEFGWDRLPPTTTIVKSITLVHRDFKSDAGTAKVQVSFIGPLGGNLDGTERSPTVTPTYYEDDFETDPDTSGDLSPTTIIGGRVRINRTQ